MTSATWLDMSAYPVGDPDTVLTPDQAALLHAALAVPAGVPTGEAWRAMLDVTWAAHDAAADAADSADSDGAGDDGSDPDGGPDRPPGDGDDGWPVDWTEHVGPGFPADHGPADDDAGPDDVDHGWVDG